MHIKNLNLYAEASLCWLGECDPKPVLRPLQDITLEELKELTKITHPEYIQKEDAMKAGLASIQNYGIDAFSFSNGKNAFQATAFFLSKGFDLGLLEHGTFILKPLK